MRMLYKAMHTRVICVCVTRVVCYVSLGWTDSQGALLGFHLLALTPSPALLDGGLISSLAVQLLAAHGSIAGRQGEGQQAPALSTDARQQPNPRTGCSASFALFSALEVSSWRVWTGAGGDRWGPC